MLEVSLSAFYLFFITTLHSVLLKYFSFDFLKFDVAIPLLVYQTFFRRINWACVFAIISGFIQEGFSTCPPGTFVFTKVSIFLLCLLVRERFFIESEQTFALLCGLFYILESLVTIGLSLIMGGLTSSYMNIFTYLMPNGVFTALFSMILYRFFLRFNQIPGEKEWE